MKILVANNHLDKTGGTENYVYALIAELKRREGITLIEYACNPEQVGVMASKIEKELGVGFCSQKRYDLIIANHVTMVFKYYRYGTVIQTCHGIYPDLEQPSKYADILVAISEEVSSHLKQKGYNSKLILNGIDCNRFAPVKAINSNLTTVLSLCQGDAANGVVSEAAQRLGLKFIHASKTTDNIYDIERLINESDLVVGIGRSLYDAMACGRAVISYDGRDYCPAPNGEIGMGDGYLTTDTINDSIKFNCSGRGAKKTFNSDSFVEELKRYKSSDGDDMRQFALNNLNIELAVNSYFELYKNRSRVKCAIRYIPFIGKFVYKLK